MGSTLLLVFLMVDVFIIGVVAAVAAKHLRAHYRPEIPPSEKPHIPTSVKERMLHASEAQFETVLHHSVDSLQHDLLSTSDQINDMIKRFAGEIVNDELVRYRTELAKLQKQAETNMSVIKQEVEGHKAEIEARLTQELEAEKQLLIKKIDTKLGDAVASFLLEALQHNVDLGNQGEYLMALLEEHKADFAREVKS